MSCEARFSHAAYRIVNPAVFAIDCTPGALQVRDETNNRVPLIGPQPNDDDTCLTQRSRDITAQPSASTTEAPAATQNAAGLPPAATIGHAANGERNCPR